MVAHWQVGTAGLRQYSKPTLHLYAELTTSDQLQIYIQVILLLYRSILSARIKSRHNHCLLVAAQPSLLVLGRELDEAEEETCCLGDYKVIVPIKGGLGSHKFKIQSFKDSFL